jgi:GrpB-like predicted nucleotidyltransferase (UPF0157 family)
MRKGDRGLAMSTGKHLITVAMGQYLREMVRIVKIDKFWHSLTIREAWEIEDAQGRFQGIMVQ